MITGVSGELSFAARAAEHDMTILFPYNNTTPYDVVVDAGHGFQRVQVKTTNNYNKERDCYRVATSHGHGGVKVTYTQDDADYVACQTPDNTWYIIPITEVEGVGSINLYPHRGSLGVYELWRERWDLLM